MSLKIGAKAMKKLYWLLSAALLLTQPALRCMNENEMTKEQPSVVQDHIQSLSQRSMSALVKNPEALYNALISEQSSFIFNDHPELLDLIPTGNPSITAALQRVIDCPLLPLESRCTLWLKFQGLSPALFEQNAFALFQENTPLPEAIARFIGHRIPIKGFDAQQELNLALLEKHVSAQTIAKGMYERHIKDLAPTPHTNWANWFKIEPGTENIPENIQFHENTLSAINVTNHGPGQNDGIYRIKIVQNAHLEGQKTLFTVKSPVVSFMDRVHGNPATMSNDGSMLAFVSPGEDIKVYMQDSDNTWIHRLSLVIPQHEHIRRVAFSFDNSIVRFTTFEDTNFYYQLPTQYLQTRQLLTAQQLWFIIALQNAFKAETMDKTMSKRSDFYTFASNLVHDAFASEILITFPKPEFNMFCKTLNWIMGMYQSERKHLCGTLVESYRDCLGKAEIKPAAIDALMSYAHPEEIALIKSDLAEIRSIRLLGKISKNLIDVLKKYYPGRDFSSYLAKKDYVEKEKLTKKQLFELLELFIALRSKMTADAFVGELLAIMQKSVDHFNAYC